MRLYFDWENYWYLVYGQFDEMDLVHLLITPFAMVLLFPFHIKIELKERDDGS